MTVPPRPPRAALSRHLSSGREAGAKDRGYVRETFRLPRTVARAKAREWFDSFPKAAYWTTVESWRVLPDDTIEFTMRRLPTAD